MTPCKGSKEPKKIVPRGKSDSACRIVTALPEEDWLRLTAEERLNVDYWILTLDVPEKDPLGDSYFYRQFEAEAPQKTPSEAEIIQAKANYLQPYKLLSFAADSSIQLETTMGTIRTEANEFLDRFCTDCSIYKKALTGRDGKPLCYNGFTKGFYVPFYFALPRTRKPRSDADEKDHGRSILIHDLRFYGHPVTVALTYPNPQNKRQRDLLLSLDCCYPGSGKSANRYSKRLGERIDEALTHGIKKRLIIEGSSLSEDVIYHWQEREKRTAARALQKAAAKYNMECCTDFSSTTLYKRVTIYSSKGAPPYSKGYRFVIRQEHGKSLRLTSVYPEHEWTIMKKLCYGIPWFEKSRQAPDHFPLSPLRLFNLAVDFLSTRDEHGFQLSGFNSPILVALIFLTALNPHVVYRAFGHLNAKSATFLRDCFGDLLRIREQFQGDMSEFIPRSLHAFSEEFSSNDNTSWENTMLEWYETWADRAAQSDIFLPWLIQQPSLPKNLNILLNEDLLELSFPLASDIEDMGELITRLLIFNPVTLSADGNNTGNQCSSTTYPYKRKPDGTFDFENVRPGIDIEGLSNLLEQGFLFQERTSLFRLRA